MKVLSLFAGIGGFDLGLELAGFETVAQVEIDDYCQKILEYHFPHAKRYRDIKGVTGEQITRDCGTVELVCGGFPCQDISSAGKGAGLDGERSRLWWEMHRLIDELRPRWVIAENVSALRTRGLDRVCASMESLGYQVWCFGISAQSTGLPHERQRVFIVGYSPSERQRKPYKKTNSIANSRKEGIVSSGASFIPDTNSDELREQSGWSWREKGASSLFTAPAGADEQQYDWEEPRTIESRMGVTTNGIPWQLAVRAIGNALVPAIPYVLGRAIKRIEQHK